MPAAIQIPSAVVSDPASLLKEAQEEAEVLRHALVEVLDCYATRVKELEEERTIVNCQLDSGRETRKQAFPSLVARLAHITNADQTEELSDGFMSLVSLFTEQEQDNIRLMAQVESLSATAAARQDELDVLYDQQVQGLARQFEEQLTADSRRGSFQITETAAEELHDRETLTPPIRPCVASRVRPATATSRMQKTATTESRMWQSPEPKPATMAPHQRKRPASAKIRTSGRAGGTVTANDLLVWKMLECSVFQGGGREEIED